MRNELRVIQHRVGITFIYITHDQGEALTMSDRIAVMNEGVIEQVGDGHTSTTDPGTAFVASFVGGEKPFNGTVAQAAATGPSSTRLSARCAAATRASSRRATMPSCSSVRNCCGSARTPRIPTLLSQVLNPVAFEGNASHVFLKGAGKPASHDPQPVGRQDKAANSPSRGRRPPLSPTSPALGSASFPRERSPCEGGDIVFLVPVVVIAIFWLMARYDRELHVDSASRSFFPGNGIGLWRFLSRSVAFWTVSLGVCLFHLHGPGVVPSVSLPLKSGRPEDYLTLEQYRSFVYDLQGLGLNTTHMSAFVWTIVINAFCLCWSTSLSLPDGFYLAKVGTPEAAGDPAGADRALLGQRDFAAPSPCVCSSRPAGSSTTLWSAPVSPPSRSTSSAMISASVRPLLRLPAADDLPGLQRDREPRQEPDRGGARPGRIVVAYPHRSYHAVCQARHRRGLHHGVHAHGRLARRAPVPGWADTLRFTPIVYDRFFQAFNWPHGAAYAFILLLACVLFVMAMLSLGRLTSGR